MDEQDEDAVSKNKYTAVIYYHGMGSQRRYEEVSRLVDALDTYVHGERGKGILAKIRPGLEPGRGGHEKDVSYIRVIRKGTNENAGEERKVYRFYEYYWAPVAAGGQPAAEVVKWLFKRAFTPFQTLCSAWRERQRLRRASLHALWSTSVGPKKTEIDRKDVRKVLLAYHQFEGPDARGEYPEGSYNDFQEYIKGQHQSRPETQKRLVRLVRKWRRFYVQSELFNTAVLMTLFLALSMGVAAFAGLGYVLLKCMNVLSTTQLANTPLAPLDKLFALNWKNTVSLVGLLLSLLGIKSFLKNYLGDVQIWTTYEETDAKYVKRKEVLERSCQLLMHVLTDDRCERIVLIGHSLGSAIAFDTLLEAGRYNRARNPSDSFKGPLPFDKIDHFITLGSPIDKVHYFFESHQGKYHRYNRVVEEIRGDIGTPPFAHNNKPHIHWLNFWDQGDLVSGALQTPSNGRTCDLRVDNIHAANYFFPFPAASHCGYFKNRSVMEKIFEVVFKNKYSFHDAPLSDGEGRDYDSLFTGPGKVRTTACVIQTMAASLPWLILLAVSLHVFAGGGMPGLIVTAVIYAELLILAILWAVSAARGHLDPLPARKDDDGRIDPNQPRSGALERSDKRDIAHIVEGKMIGHRS